MNKQLVTTLFFLISHFFFGQEIQWTKPQKTKGFASQIQFDGPDSFFSMKEDRHSVGKSNFYLARYENNLLIGDKSAEFKTPTGKGTPVGLVIFENKPYVFLARRNGDKSRLYVQECDRLIQPVGECKLLIEGHDNRTLNHTVYQVRVSENRQYVMITTYLFVGGFEINRYIFDLANNFRNTLDKVGNEKGYGSGQTSAEFVTNDGHLLALRDKILFKDGERYITNRKLLIIRSDQEVEIPIDLSENRSVTTLYASSDNSGNLHLMCFFRDNSTQQIGIIHTKIAKESGRVLQNDNLNLNPANYTGDPEVNTKSGNDPEYNVNSAYEVTRTVPLDDGSMIAFLERTQKFSFNNQSVNYSNYSMLIVKILPDGKLGWATKVKKYQSTHNDKGLFNSFGAYQTPTEIHVFFRDNLKNYTDSGEYISSDKISGIDNAGDKNTVLAEVTVDIADGSSSRKIFLGVQADKMDFIPQSITVDYKLNQIFFYKCTYSPGSNLESYGRMKI